ncbi:LAQU0S04e01574g1_1 [Lachancea quebecensis]|uniref:chitinase n=1 Tax=Lachancea quebecensis TaxID=1654605 RepID=A0A0P1KPP9_9SACH|nr:LAQU0S04e01574g1_1 [Lachancea quebecensis]
MASFLYCVRKFLVAVCVIAIILEAIFTGRIRTSTKMSAFQEYFNSLGKSNSMLSTNREAGTGLSPDNKSGFVTGMYYSNWSPYAARKHFPHDIDFRKLTHIYYAFLVVNSETGECQLSDEWSDVQMDLYKQMISSFKKLDLRAHFPTDPKKKLPLGCIGELFFLKYSDFLVRNGGSAGVNNFKTIMSVGGWSNREAFTSLVESPTKLEAFVDSCVKKMFEYGFDGIDIDWEFPKNDAKEPNVYLSMLKSLRERLDLLESHIFGSKDHERHFTLTSAISADEEVIKYLPLQEADRYVDYWNLMAYDFSGAWSAQTAYQSNLYSPVNANKRDTNNKNSADNAVRFLTDGFKLAPKKIVLGMPAYGRGFKDVEVSHKSIQNVIGQPFQGVSGLSEGESGISLYKQLPLKGGMEFFDRNAVSAYSVKLSHNKKQAELMVYDNVDSMIQKARYVEKNHLGGGFWWESCGEDYKGKSLVGAFTNEIKYLNKTEPTIYSLPEVVQYYLKLHPGGFLASTFQN